MKHLLPILVVIFSFFPKLSAAQENANTLIYEGNQSFNKKDYDAAGGKYMKAAKINDKNFSAHFNLGNTFYKRKMYPEAKAEYEKSAALAKSGADRMAALYNLGNAHIQAGEPEKAAEKYRQALKYDPYNADARRNYQIALLKNQQKSSGKNGSDNKDEGEDSKKNASKPGDKGDKSKQSGGKSGDGKGKNGDSPKDSDKNGDGGTMPKDLEKQILNRAGEKERETARRILNKNTYSIPQSNEKDW